MKKIQHEYRLQLASLRPINNQPSLSNATMRIPVNSDTQALADLMFDSYRGTIDYHGETLDDAIDEVQAYFAGQRGGAPQPHCSWLCFDQETLVAACLVVFWDEQKLPLIAYVMTRAEWKSKGLGSAVLQQALYSLTEHGHREVRAVITEGNTPSERIFRRAGFERIAKGNKGCS